MIRSWNDQKEIISRHIRLISHHFGDYDQYMIKCYTDDVILAYRSNLAVAETCFAELAEQLRYALSFAND